MKGKIKGRYKKKDNVNYMHINGFIGTLGMDSEAVINFYYESLNLPNGYEVSIDEEKTDIMDCISEHEFVREVVSSITFKLPVAIELRDWLDEYIKNAENEDNQNE